MKLNYFLRACTFLVLSTAAIAFDPDPRGLGGFPAPKWDCMELVYKVEFNHLEKMRDQQRERTAVNKAIEACSMGEEKVCIEYLYQRYQEIGPVGDKYSYFQRAVKGCQGPFSPDCAKLTEKMLAKFYPPLKALEDGINMCRFDVRAPCIEYAFSQELHYRPTELLAAEQAGQACKGGVSKNCLAFLNEELLMVLHPDAQERWGHAVNGCRRRP